VTYCEENIRHLYRSFWISKEIEVYVLDSRNGYLGKEQARWLKESLRKTTAQYKLIFTGKSFGIQFIDQLNSASSSSSLLDQLNNEGEAEEEETPPSGEAEEEGGEENEGEPTPAPEDPEKTTTSSSRKTTVSSSRQRALEATKEEFDEDGLGKTSLQHVIIQSYRKQYPDGYPLPNGEGEESEKLESERLPDDNSSYTNPLPQILLDSSRDAGDDERGGIFVEKSGDEEEGDRLTDHEEQSETLSQCFNATNLSLLGGIILFSSTQASDSYVATYSFSETEPPIPSSLQISTQLAAYCLEVGIGLGPGVDQGMRCVPSAHKNPAAEKIIRQGHHLLFRSLSPQRAEEGQLGQVKEEPTSPSLVPVLPLNGPPAQGEQQREGGDDNAFMMVQEVVENPISASLLLHEDGSLSIKLKCVGTGRTVYQVTVSGEE
jgi:hypothetical protein